MGHSRARKAVCAGVLGVLLLVPTRAGAYSVLTHEANIDALWASDIVPLLRARFPGTTATDLANARAYAYGGSVVQDLGYYPFGSAFFTNLLHYVKTGDFVDAMLRDARDLDEYAFAIGALCHYESDAEGHSIAINRALPLIYPKMRAKYGDSVPYEKAPKEHILTEFAFDVLLVANGGYKLQAYHDFIGFQVSKPLLERAFRETYGFEMKDLFLSEDLAIGTYRHSVGGLIPRATRIAWDQKRDAIIKTTPGMIREQFVMTMTAAEYMHDFGNQYRRPGIGARIVAFLYRLLPKIGPLRPLAFKVPTPDAERLYLESVTRSRARFAEALRQLRAGSLHLPNINLDTGRPSQPGDYALADATVKHLRQEQAKSAPATPPRNR